MTLATGTFNLSIDEIEIRGPLPEYASERNCEMVYGLAPRAFGALLRKRGFPLPIVRVGRQKLVERAAFTAYLRTLAVRPGAGEGEATEVAAGKTAEELQGEMLRELGYVAPKGRRP